MSIRIIAQGLNDLERFMTVVPDVARRAATLAINQTAERKGIQALRAQMEEEVAFPPRYLADKRRFGVTKRATKNDLEAIITGRQRPTSLARFASGNALIDAATMGYVTTPAVAALLAQRFTNATYGEIPLWDGNILNGKVVNEGTKSSHTRGKILFQSEGAEVFFRTIELHPLKK